MRRTAGIVAILCMGVAVLMAAPAGRAPKRPPITGVASFAVKVSDLASARAFYSGVLGLEQAFTTRNPTGGADSPFSRSTTGNSCTSHPI